MLYSFITIFSKISIFSELGGEFPVEELHTGEGGLLRVCMEGVRLLFAQRKVILNFIFEVSFAQFMFGILNKLFCI
jgi:hypothetical protein